MSMKQHLKNFLKYLENAGLALIPLVNFSERVPCDFFHFSGGHQPSVVEMVNANATINPTRTLLIRRSTKYKPSLIIRL